MSARVTIGDFSRASHLSVKTLRHYHDVGLLEPSEIDADNGYRYYSHEQIAVAQVIRRLRGLQMPVTEVKAVLGAREPQTRNQLIAGHLERLESELAETRGAVIELRELLNKPPAELAVEHRTVPATPAIAIHDTIDRDDIFAWWQGALGELHANLQGQTLTRAGAPGGIYAGELFEHDRGQATVFIPIDGRARTVGRVAPTVIPPAELAIVHHHGAFDGIDMTYGQLATHVLKHELNIQAPVRENYPTSFLDTPDPQTWDTEIGWPILRADTPT